MARRKKPKITGRDPEYTSAPHQFTKLATHKGDDVAREPTAPPQKTQVAETPKAPAKAEPKPVANSKPNKPKVRKPTSAPTSKTAEPATKKAIGGTRRVELLAALTPELHAKLQKLDSIGIAYKDAMSVAGRRATKEFEAKPTFVDKTDVDRLPTSQAYRSSKNLPIDVLEALHDAANPLRLASDGAMVRGQFEPLYWKHLEDVLKELAEKYSK